MPDTYHTAGHRAGTATSTSTGTGTTSKGIGHHYIKPRTPRLNGKVCEDSCWRGTGPGLTLVKV
jgi:hypothetical protein